MLLQINSVNIGAYPKDFQVTVLDIDDGQSSVRSSNGLLNRDRVAVKRQIDMTFGTLKWSEVSSILQAMSGIYFSFYYPDPMDGNYATRTFYVGNRVNPFAIAQGTDILWSGLKMILTEQ